MNPGKMAANLVSPYLLFVTGNSRWRYFATRRVIMGTIAAKLNSLGFNDAVNVLSLELTPV